MSLTSCYKPVDKYLIYNIRNDVRFFINLTALCRVVIPTTKHLIGWNSLFCGMLQSEHLGHFCKSPRKWKEVAIFMVTLSNRSRLRTEHFPLLGCLWNAASSCLLMIWIEKERLDFDAAQKLWILWTLPIVTFRIFLIPTLASFYFLFEFCRPCQ